jgi:RNA polymerase sigma-70 factor, ECF subfamily
MASPDRSWEKIVDGLRRGDEDAVRDFCGKYEQSLRRLADGRMPAGLRRRVDPEDVVQSALRTFLRRASDGQFQLSGADGLWRLLCAITLTKVKKQTRFQYQQKRDPGREVHAAPIGDDSEAREVGVADPTPSPLEAAVFTDEFHALLDAFEPTERRLIELKLQELTNEEIGAEMKISERTVRRTFKRIQARLEQELPPE